MMTSTSMMAVLGVGAVAAVFLFGAWQGTSEFEKYLDGREEKPGERDAYLAAWKEQRKRYAKDVRLARAARTFWNKTLKGALTYVEEVHPDWPDIVKALAALNMTRKAMMDFSKAIGDAR